VADFDADGLQDIVTANTLDNSFSVLLNQRGSAGWCWAAAGYPLAGVHGNPLLVGTGQLAFGKPGSLTLGNAAPGALALLVVAPTGAPTPCKGGKLVPAPVAFAFSLSTDAAGSIVLPWTSWPAALSGSTLYFQYAIVDPAAVLGVALSGAVKASTP
jgi:hypothetical protein